MPNLSADAREKLEAYLRFQKDFGIERVRIAPFDGAFAAAGAPARLPPPPAQRMPRADGQPALTLLQEEVGTGCMRCKLSGLGRKKVVFGSGSGRAELVFVGEGPGADEDEQGVPFIGRGGQLLTDMIQKGMGLRREEVYICNVVKCRPPENRTPEADEIATCSPFMFQQIAAIQPRLVCALGATAAQALRPFKGALGGVRGKIHAVTIGGFATNLVVTYHPAYLLRDPAQKKEAWKDLQLAMEFLGLAPR